MTEEPADAVGPGHRLAVGIEPRRQPVVVIGAVHVVLDVLLAAPDDLDRPFHLLRDLDGEDRAVDVEPPAEAAAEQVVVDPDRFLRQAGELGDRGLRQGRHLRADPDVAAVLADVDGAVHRLHRRMGEERHLIDGVDPLRRAGERLLDVAVAARHRAGLL